MGGAEAFPAEAWEVGPLATRWPSAHGGRRGGGRVEHGAASVHCFPEKPFQEQGPQPFIPGTRDLWDEKN